MVRLGSARYDECLPRGLDNDGYQPLMLSLLGTKKLEDELTRSRCCTI